MPPMQPKSLADGDASASLDTPATPAEQRAFGRFALIDLIGRGPTAEAHRAIAIDEPVVPGDLAYVVKLFTGQAANAPFSKAIHESTRGAARLERTNLLEVTDAGIDNGELFVARPYVDGFDLAGLLRRCGQRRVPLPLELGLHIVLSTLRGLDEAYKLVGASTAGDGGLAAAHGAVCPTNILIASDGVVRVSDFGLSRADHALPNADEVLAARAGYMSPEQARREPIDARADIFSVGIVLWELIVGRRCYRPPRAGVGVPVLEQALAAQIVAPPKRGLRREEQLHDVLEHALAVDKTARYESVAAMLADLEGYVVGASHDPGNAQLARWLKRFFGAELATMRHELSVGAAQVRKLPRPEPAPPEPPEIDELPPMRGRLPSDQELTLIECDEDLPQDAQDVLEAARRGDSRPPAHLQADAVEDLAIPSVVPPPLDEEVANEESSLADEAEPASLEDAPKKGSSVVFWIFVVLLFVAALACANLYLRIV
ncbi:MAG: Serine/threonine kinase [Myxococcaceae bacterium]|nr:Serine/threonine kinase [Myxococcaceae bacterium]